MTFFPSLPESAGPPNVYKLYPDVYRPWAELSQALMNGPSPLSQGQRELMLAYAAGLSQCDFVCGAHAEVAYAWGIDRGLVERLLLDPETPLPEPRLGPILAYVRKLCLDPQHLAQVDADAVFAEGWDEQALHDAIAIAARAGFMQRLVQGFGFAALPAGVARSHAAKRVEHGYVNVYGAFRKNPADQK